MSVDLSVIVITRNEEARIGACLEACVAAIRRATREGLLRSAEVVLADSASTDRTVEIAKGFPVTIVQMLPTQPRSAAAGRFVGLRHATGDLILFVDGDYVLFEDWLPEAIRAIRADGRTAAVCGRDVEEFTGESLLMRRAKAAVEAGVTDPQAMPIGLYRREALDRVGGVHPFLRGGEDRDLAHRLRAAGYRLRRLDRDMGVHRWAEEGALDYVTYFRSVLAWSVGDGQTFRARRDVGSLRAEAIGRYANARYAINYLTGIALGALLLANLFGLLAGWWPVVLVDLVVLAALLAIRTAGRAPWRELGYRLHVVPYTVIRHAGFLLGALRTPVPPDRYPGGERVLQVRRVAPSET